MSVTSDLDIAVNRVHALMRAKKFLKVRQLLLDDTSGRIKNQYSVIPNHAWYILGDCAYRQKRFEEAKKFFRRSLNSDRSDVNAMLALGNCHFQLREASRAQKILARALALSPRDVRIRYNLANAFFDLGKYREAISLYLRVARSRDKTIAKRAKKNLALAKSLVRLQLERRIFAG